MLSTILIQVKCNMKKLWAKTNENEIKIEQYIKISFSFWIFVLPCYLTAVFCVRLSGFILFENVLCFHNS